METTFSTPEKAEPKKYPRDQSKRRAGQPKFSKNGRPGKRTPQLEKDLLAAIETGAPYRIACMACGISDDTFGNWRRKDPVFARAVEVASGKTALRLLKKIEKNADENFSAAAWLLERRFPESFSRPEIQLGLTINQTMNNNVLVISAEQAESLSRRNKLIDKELDEVAKVYESRRGSRSSAMPGERSVDGAAEMICEVESQSSLVPSGPIQLPPVAQRTPGWWRQLSTGDNGREISIEVAEFVLRDIAAAVLGAPAAGKVKMDFGEEAPALSELWSKINESAGADGWAALVARGASPQEGPSGSAGRAALAKGASGG